MDESVKLKISSKQAMIQISFVVLAGVAVYLLILLLVNSLGDLIGTRLDWLHHFGGLITLVLVVIGLVGAWIRLRYHSYILTKDSLIVEKYRGLFGAKTSRVYPYKFMTSLELHQTALGYNLNYGVIIIANMSMMGEADELVLRNLESPNEALKAIQSYINQV